jgi:bifunctional non-homologous end joining protein LigD
MLCAREEASEALLGSSDFVFELKLDGVRIVAEKDGDRVSLTYRKARDATESYREIVDAVRALDVPRVVLDGEVVAFDDRGRPNFQRLGHRIQTMGRGRAAHSVPVAYVVFDVLALADRDLRGHPLEERRAVLERIVPEKGAHLRLAPTFDDGHALFAFCRTHDLEGLVAKRRGSTYRAGERSPDWIKVKCEHEADLVVIGWTQGEGTRARLGALDLGAYEGDRLVVRGSVGSGLDEATIDALVARLVTLEAAGPVASGKYLKKRGRRHARPEIVVSVRYGGWTSDGLMRHPVFRGVRPDVAPTDCRIAPDL